MASQSVKRVHLQSLYGNMTKPKSQHAYLHLPAAFSIFNVLAILVIYLCNAICVCRLASNNIQVWVTPGASIQILVSQVHVILADLCDQAREIYTPHRYLQTWCMVRCICTVSKRHLGRVQDRQQKVHWQCAYDRRDAPKSSAEQGLPLQCAHRIRDAAFILCRGQAYAEDVEYILSTMCALQVPLCQKARLCLLQSQDLKLPLRRYIGPIILDK